MAATFNDNNFEQEVLNSDIPVLVDFFAEWCGPCKMMAPLVEKMAEKFSGKVKIGKLNVEESMETAQKYKVMTIPTFIVFRNGEPDGTVVGGVSEQDLVSKLGLQ